MKRAILIKSCQKNKDKQGACDGTWVPMLRTSDIPVFMVEGGHARLNHKTRIYCADRLELGCGDDYMSNSIKLKLALQYLLGTQFEQLFICDDDTFVHPYRWIKHQPEGVFECLMTPEIPWCHGGGGWYMNRSCCQLYVEKIQEVCSWDDRLASELAEANGVQITVRADLYTQWPNSRVTKDNSLITCHKVDAKEMRELWSAICT